MLAVSVARGAGEDADHDLRPEAAEHPHGVLEENVLRPETKGLVERAGVAEVVRAREVLPGAVQTPRRQQLLRAHQTEPDAELRSERFWPPSPRERERYAASPPCLAPRARS